MVLTILKNMKVNGKDYPYMMEKMFETTNQMYNPETPRWFQFFQVTEICTAEPTALPKAILGWSYVAWREVEETHLATGCGYTWLHMVINWLVVEPPLWKIWKSVGIMTFPIYGKIKNVPNQQPVHDCEWLFSWLWVVIFMVKIVPFLWEIPVSTSHFYGKSQSVPG